MLRTFIMATSKNGRVPPPRSKSTLPTRKGKIQARLINTGSSPVYKAPSENSLVTGLRSLSVQDRASRLTSAGGTRQNTSGRRRLLSSDSSKITEFKSDLDIAKFIKFGHAKKIVVCAGAGISTASGIPDFRTPGTGLYDNLQQYSIPYPEAIFDIDYFHQNPRPFFTLAKELYPSGKYRPNYNHYFLRMLYDKGQLLRIYTQNIDGLERLAGIPANKLVEAHGTFATATCTICDRKYEGEEIKDAIFADRVPKCKRKGCPGVIKPDIVFFGEDLPRRFYLYLKDMLQADLILVMGTSLEVQPFAGIVDVVRYNVPRILFNMKAVGPFRHRRRAHDFVVEGDLIQNIQTFVCRLGWKHELADVISKCEGQKQAWISSDDSQGAGSSDVKDTSSDSAAVNGELHTGSQPAAPDDDSDLNQPKRRLHTLSSAKSEGSRPKIAPKHGPLYGTAGNKSSGLPKLPYRSQQSASRLTSYRERIDSSSSSSEDSDSEESSSDDSR